MSLSPAQRKIAAIREATVRAKGFDFVESTLQESVADFDVPQPQPQPLEHVDDWCARKWQVMSDALNLSGTQAYLMENVFWVACHVHDSQGYSRNASQTEFFLEARAVYYLLGIPHRTFYWCMNQLERLGVVELHGHVGEYKAVDRMDGSTWAVRLSPPQQRPARCSYEARSSTYVQPLEVRMARGETVCQSIAQSKERPADTREVRLQMLSRALPPPTDNPSLRMTVQRDRVSALTSLLNVPNQPKGDPARNRAVQLFARSAAAALDDAKSYRFYCRLAWNTLRLFDRGQDYFRAVHDVLNTVLSDKREGEKQQKPGALVVKTLRDRGLYEAIFDAHVKGDHINTFRVGAPPSA